MTIYHHLIYWRLESFITKSKKWICSYGSLFGSQDRCYPLKDPFYDIRRSGSILLNLVDRVKIPPHHDWSSHSPVHVHPPVPIHQSSVHVHHSSRSHWPNVCWHGHGQPIGKPQSPHSDCPHEWIPPHHSHFRSLQFYTHDKTKNEDHAMKSHCSDANVELNSEDMIYEY